jgi:DNA-binding response OmpR family regulator
MAYSTVMVIDSEDSILEIIAIILEEANFRVDKYLSPPIIPFKHPVPDLIILNVGPNNRCNRDFFDLLKKYKSTLNIPVMLTSTLQGLKSVAESWEADSYLSKPFDLSFLLSKVSELIASKR